MAFGYGLNSFADGLMGGMDQGQQLAQRLMQIRQAQALQQAQGAVGDRYGMSPPPAPMGGGQPQGPAGPMPMMPQGQGGQPPMGGPPPMGGGRPPMMPSQGSAPPMGMGGAPPMPPPQGPAGPQGRSPSMPMPGAQPMPQAGPPPGPMPGGAMPPGGGVPPSTPPSPQQPGSPGGGAFSGVAQGTQDISQRVDQTIEAMAANLKKANPGLKGQAMFMAIQQQLELMKGLDPVEKDLAKAQLAYYQAVLKAQTSSSNAEVRADASRDVASIRGDASRDVAGTNAGARRYGADQGRAGREYAADRGLEGAGVRADASRDVAGTNADARRDVAGTNADARRYGADRSYQGQFNRSQGQAGGQPTYLDPQGKPVAAPGAPGAPGAGGQPPFAAAKYRGRTATSPDGTKWRSDGKRWIKVK